VFFEVLGIRLEKRRLEKFSGYGQRFMLKFNQ